MKARILQLVFVLMVVGALFCVGCGGSGSSGSPAMVHDSPVGKVEQIVSNWRASGGMTLTKTESGELRLVGADTVQSTPYYGDDYGNYDDQQGGYDDHHEEYKEPIGTLMFKDLSGETWTLDIMSVDYLSNINARVNTRYQSRERTFFAGLKIVFIMFKDRGEWFLNDMEIAEIPATEQLLDLFLISGTTSKRTFVTGDDSQAGVEMLLTNSLNSQLVYYSTTDSEGNFSFSVPAGNYDLSVSASDRYMFAESGQVVSLTVSDSFSLVDSLELIPRADPPSSHFSITGSIFKQPKISEDVDESGVVMTLYSLTDSSTRQSETTGPLGHFSFTDLPAGSYHLKVSEDSDYKLLSTADYVSIQIVDQSFVFEGLLIIVPNDYVWDTPYEVTGSFNKLALKEGDTESTPVEFHVIPEAELPYIFTYISDAGGDFVVSLPPGRYHAVVNPETTGYYNLGQQIAVEGEHVYAAFFEVIGSDVTLGQIDLVPSDKYVFAGYITGEDDEVVPHAAIQLTHDDTQKDYSTVSGEDGFYLILVDDPGYYTMVVDRTGYEPQTQTVWVGEEPNPSPYSIRLQRK